MNEAKKLIVPSLLAVAGMQAAAMFTGPDKAGKPPSMFVVLGLAVLGAGAGLFIAARV